MTSTAHATEQTTLPLVPPLPLDLAPANEGEHVELCPDGSVNLAVIINAGRLVVVLRALAEPDVVVHVPATQSDAVHLTRALADSLRYLTDARGCPACDTHWRAP